MNMARCHTELPARALRWIALAAFALIAAPAAAQDHSDDIAALADALRLTDTIAIMYDEGLDYADQVAEAMLEGGPTAGWQQQIEQLYDAGRMEALVLQGLEKALEGADLAPMLAFYNSEAGRRAVELELAARRAFLDPAAEDAAREAALRAMQQPPSAQPELLHRAGRLIEGGDLIERNVTASLNADMMFWRGVMDGGGPAPAGEEGEEADLADIVTATLEETRRETEIWITAFLMVACGPLTPAQMDEYATFFQSSDGRVLNAALFDAFNAMYDQMAYLLGRATGAWMNSAPL
ncbi:DUF2059 domain-containing protein [Roseovarius dicentrarchi]|uniref:DUF2059 domain-containing protein n=1 Tax=Roseovarius dicentrarchi TaxID=2250573 RepID=UPI000DE85F4E|nr:DUF2059 domain-containing protein [Roseovarius dicentrarchi]